MKNIKFFFCFCLVVWFFGRCADAISLSHADTVDVIEQGLTGKRLENEPLKLSERFQEILQRAGAAFGKYLPKECFSSSITRFLQKNVYLPQEIRSNVRVWLKMARSEDFNVVKFWDKVYNCDDFCVAVISELLDCYLTSIEESYAGVVMFDWADYEFRERTRGGPWSNMKSYDNFKILNTVVQELMNRPDLKVALHARASKFGNKLAERRRSDSRGASVRKRLIEMGISAERISVVSFGWEPPQINDAVARTHHSQDTGNDLMKVFKEYGRTSINQTTLIYFWNSSGG